MSLLLYHLLTKIKRTERERGRSLMFCPVCRRPQYMRAIVVSVKRGAGRPEEAEEARCPECETSFGPFRRGDLPTEPAWSGNLEADLPLLPASASAAIRAHIAIQEAMAAGILTPEQRAWLIRHPFIALSHEHDRLMTRPSAAQSVSAVVQLASIAAAFAAAISWYAWDSAHPSDKMRLLLWSVAISLLAATLFAVVLHRQFSWGRLRAKPLLGRMHSMLSPLHASPQELALALSELKSKKNTLARSLRPEDLERAD